MRSDFEGRNVETFLSYISLSSSNSTKAKGMEFPEGVAVDWLARNVYWTDSGKKTVEVARIDDHKGRTTPVTRVVLFEEQIKNPRGIALHSSAR